MERIEKLNKDFGIAEVLSFTKNETGFITAEVKASEGSAKILLYGAHAVSFIPNDEEELLWLSTKTEYEVGKPIRGGIPVCFPWFGQSPVDASLPKHGIARLMEWKMESARKLSNGNVEVLMSLESSDETYSLWPFEFKAIMKFEVGRKLSATLSVTNTGASEMQYSAALHTYFKVGSADSVSIEGLSGFNFYPNGSTERRIQKDPYYTLDGFVDRCYVHHAQDCIIHDVSMERSIRAGKMGSNTTVLWNPWENGAKLISDMPDDGYQEFVCVEAANNFDDTIVLQPGNVHSTSVILEVDRQ